MKSTAILAAIIAINAAHVFAQPARRGGFEISTLSTQADKVSGGDVLIRVVTPASEADNVAITVNGHAAQEDFKPTTPSTSRIVRLHDLPRLFLDSYVMFRYKFRAISDDGKNWEYTVAFSLRIPTVPESTL